MPLCWRIRLEGCSAGLLFDALYYGNNAMGHSIIALMPTGLQRFHHIGHWHFITCSCYHRQPFLSSARCRDVFVEMLEQVRQKYDFGIAGYAAILKNLTDCSVTP
jgi:hypothetical protein